MAKNSLEQVEKSKGASLQELRTALNANFRERESLIDCLLTGLIARENVFVLGPPGTAKSATSDALCKAIGGSYFNWLINKLTTPDELFGPVSIEGLRSGRYERITANKLPEAHVAFLDEIFKGSSAILNTTLTLMNERTFCNGDKVVKTPLEMVVGASNEIPQAEELGALYDRFALRIVVDRLQKDDAFEALISGGLNTKIPSISRDTLVAAQRAAEKVALSPAVIAMFVELRRTIAGDGLYVSDRKWVQALKIVRAFAHLNGNSEVTEDDFMILEHVLWSDPSQRKTVKRMVAKVSNPVGEQVLKAMDGVQEVFESLKKGTVQPMDAINKVRSAIRSLERLGDPESNPKLKDSLDQARKTSARIAHEFLGLEMA